MDVMPTEYSVQDFAHFVRVLVSRWEQAIEMKGQWGALDPEERLIYTEEWPVNNVLLGHLEEYVSQHDLSTEQKSEWVKLVELMTKHAADLEEMGYRVVSVSECEHILERAS